MSSVSFHIKVKVTVQTPESVRHLNPNEPENYIYNCVVNGIMIRFFSNSTSKQQNEKKSNSRNSLQILLIM